MADSDARAARTAVVGVVVVAITAAVISFSHVRSLALRAGESELTSWLLPVSIDGAVVAAVSVLLADSRAGRRPAPLTWLLLTLGLAASLAANVASAEPTHTARAVAAWPPVALALGIEVLAGLARRNQSERARTSGGGSRPPDRHQQDLRTGSGNGRRHAAVAVGRSGSVPAEPMVNGNGRAAFRQSVLDDKSAARLIRELDAVAPNGRASRLEIQKKLGCGGSRAARLAELARRQVLDAAS
jgi:hypothetical protein